MQQPFRAAAAPRGTRPQKSNTLRPPRNQINTDMHVYTSVGKSRPCRAIELSTLQVQELQRGVRVQFPRSSTAAAGQSTRTPRVQGRSQRRPGSQILKPPNQKLQKYKPTYPAGSLAELWVRPTRETVRKAEVRES